MPANNVNLDALINREDMEASEPNLARQSPVTEIRASELEFSANTYCVLRKPDFQRETSMWTPEKVKELILAFVYEDLVPAIVLWRSPKNYLFVIDGAHRLSSLIAWVNDDYGDGLASKMRGVSTAQKMVAQKTKEKVEEALGPYKAINEAFKNPNTPEKYKDIARQLVNCKMVVQPLLTSDVNKAERSFFKINEQGVTLTETETTLLHSRRCPNSIAARAINRRATGDPHWYKFQEKQRTEITTLGSHIYDGLYTPELTTSTIKSSALPIGGKYLQPTALPTLLHLVNITNGVAEIVPTSKENAEQLIRPDTDGSETVNYLANLKRVVDQICNRPETDYMKSLDLHPMVYFYSETGRHQPTALLATVEFISRLQKQSDGFKRFTKVRPSFEEFLIEHRDFLQQISRKARGEMKAVHNVRAFLEFVFDKFCEGADSEHAVKALQSSTDFNFLKLPSEADKPEIGLNMSPQGKSKKVIQNKLATAIRCTICGARVPDQGISFDHSKDKSEGGTATDENTEMTHHYCNSAKAILLPYLKGERTGLESANA